MTDLLCLEKYSNAKNLQFIVFLVMYCKGQLKQIACGCTWKFAYFHLDINSFKVAYTSGPIFEKIMKRYPIFSVQNIDHQIDQKHE